LAYTLSVFQVFEALFDVLEPDVQDLFDAAQIRAPRVAEQSDHKGQHSGVEDDGHAYREVELCVRRRFFSIAEWGILPNSSRNGAVYQHARAGCVTKGGGLTLRIAVPRVIRVHRCSSAAR